VKKAMVLFVLLGLIGCRNLTDLRGDGPDYTFSSSKAVDSVAQCMLYGWQSQRLLDGSVVSTFIQPYPGGKTVYTDQYTAAADVVEVKGQTEVKLYLPSWYIRENFKNITERCI